MIRSDKEELQHLVMIIVVAVMALGIAIGIVVYIKECKKRAEKDSCSTMTKLYKAKHELLTVGS